MGRQNVIFKLDTDDAKAVRGFLRLTDAQKKAEMAQMRVNRAGEKGSKIGRRMQGAAVSAATSYLSLSAALGMATTALAAFERQEQGAADRLSQAAKERARLLQLDPAKFSSRVATAERLRTDFGIDEGRAFKVVFDAASAGLEGDINTLAQGERISFAPEAAIESVQKLQSSFGGDGAGRAGGGSTRQILNKLLAAAEFSPVSGDVLAKSVAQATTNFAAIGGDDSGLLGTVATLAERFKSSDVAAERVNSLAAKVSARRGDIKSDLEGLPLLMALPELAEQGKLGRRQTLQAFLGDQGAVEGARAIAMQQADIRAAVAATNRAELATGGGGVLLSQRIGRLDSDPNLRSVELSNRTREARELTEERLAGGSRAVSDALLNSRFESNLQNEGRLYALLEDTLQRFARTVRGSDSYLSGQVPYIADPTLKAEAERVLREQGEAAEAMKEAAKTMGVAGRNHGIE